MADNTFEGHTNYATWNVALWADNVYSIYQAKCAWLERSKRPVTAQAARWFYREHMRIGNTDLKGNKDPGTRYRDIDWADLADTWENDRQEILAYANG